MNELEEIQKEMVVAFGKETANQIFGFLSDILRPPARELGGLLADRMRYYRFKTQIEIIQKAKNHLDKLGIKTQKIPVKLLASLLDHCSWEEEDNMKERWASLLANCASEGEKTDNYIAFTYILNQLSPHEAKFTDLMYDELLFPARRRYRTIPSYQSTSRISEMMNITNDEAFIICDNLKRLNLIQTNLEFKLEERDISYSKIQPTYNEVSLTYLGKEFVRKCRVPFTKNHANEIEKELIKLIDDIVKNYDDKWFDSFVKTSIRIYPHLIIHDLKGGVCGALNKFIWKSGNINDYKGYSINDTERNEIVKYCIEYIIKNNK